MKRTEINHLLTSAVSFFNKHHFRLPAWALFSTAEWKRNLPSCTEILENRLGWDITDFGGPDFKKRGLLLFTLRNGNPARDKKPYAEKIMIADENQETPMHFHWKKMEDIINRGGGDLVLELYGSNPSETFSNEPVSVSVDGIRRTLDPGCRIILTPGQSICLEPGVYHRFFGYPGKGRVLIGEVSMVNDDSADNRFYEPAGRFPAIEEDAKPLYLLAQDYATFLR